MGEFFAMGDQQRSALMGEVPDSMESPMMRAWLGPEAKQQGLEPYEGVSRTHDHVDHLQVGRNLGHHVMTNMLQSNISIALLLPPQQVSPDLSFFQWTVEYANPGVAPHVPEEAPFYEITYAIQPRKKKIERRGVALRMTANIMLTAAGMARLRAQLMVLAATMLLTIEYLTMRAIVTCHDGPMFRRKMTLDRFTPQEVEQRIAYDAAGFASWNRVSDINVANDMAEVEKLLRQFVAGPYAILYPAGRQALLGGQVVDTGESLKVKAINSQKGVLQFDSLPSNLRMADGSLAFPVPDYSFGTSAVKEQPLLRPTMIGEHNRMTGINCNDLAYRVGVQLPGGGYSTCQRDIYLYDVSVDTYVKVGFREAFEASNYVPLDDNAGDYLDEFLKTAHGRQLTTQSFIDEKRSAPSRVYFENGTQRVILFGQYDQNIISHELHRSVGDTIAACVHAAEGEGLGAALASGIQLLRELAAAPFNRAFANALSAVLDTYETVPFSDAAPDLAARYNAGDEPVYPQESDGTLRLQGANASAAYQSLAEAINTGGVPPFLLSVGGLRFLARMSEIEVITGRAVQVAQRAKDLMETTERIYNVLREKFPGALGLSEYYRPVNFFPADGFGTFFSSVFLNNGNTPVLHIVGDGTVVTPFVWTLASRRAGDVRPFATGTSGNPFEPIAAGLASIGKSLPQAHMRTPWEAQHTPMMRAMSQRESGSSSAESAAAGSRRRVSFRQPSTTQAQDEEEDYFGITPTFRGSASASGSDLAPVGQPLHNEPGIYGTVRGMRGMRPGSEGVIDNPMETSNMRNNWNAADRISDPLVRVCTLAYLTAPCDRMYNFNRMMDSDILVPFDILLIRPVCEMDMYSVAVMKPGIDTGSNVMAGATLDYGIDVDHQTRKLTFALRHASIIKVPDHVALLPSRMARRYVPGGGGSTKLYRQYDDFHLQRGRPDLIPMVVPFGHKIHRYEPIGGINVDGVLDEVVGSSRFPDAQYYEHIWRLSEQAKHTRRTAHSWEGASLALPDYTWQGEQLSWDKERRLPAQGHRRGGCHPGCRSVWDGLESIFPPPSGNYADW